MLEKILDYEEKRKQKKKELDPKKAQIYLIIFGIAVIIVLLRSIMTGEGIIKQETKKTLKAFVTDEKLDNFFNKINNNYELTAKINKDDSEYQYLYSTDGTFESYEVRKYDIGYLKYKNEYYVVKNNDLVKSNNFNIDKYVNTNLCNLNFIKNIIKKSECVRKNKNISSCEISFNELLREYNYEFNTSYQIYDDETKITMFVYNSASSITNFKMDYRLLNNMISDTAYDSLTYNIFVSDIDKVDYSEIMDTFPNLFKK